MNSGKFFVALILVNQLVVKQFWQRSKSLDYPLYKQNIVVQSGDLLFRRFLEAFDLVTDFVIYNNM